MPSLTANDKRCLMAIARTRLASRIKRQVLAVLSSAVGYSNAFGFATPPSLSFPPNVFPRGGLRSLLASLCTIQLQVLKWVVSLGNISRRNKEIVLRLILLDFVTPPSPPRLSIRKKREWCLHCRGFWSVNRNGSFHGAHECKAVLPHGLIVGA